VIKSLLPALPPFAPVRIDIPAPTPPVTPAPARLDVSIIVPTFREALNLPALTAAIIDMRDHSALTLDLWLMDDQSRDGSREVVQTLNLPWVHLIERTGPRGLGRAVLEGLRTAQGQRLVVMDADLSHPASAIPAMIDRLDHGADFVFGSRYIAGGNTAKGWGLLRAINSLGATLLARPLTRLRDPMSGFFAFDRARLDDAHTLDPVGYKIGLELVVKSRAKSVVEVPILFANRVAGTSKLTLRQQLLYLEHLRRLYSFKFLGPAT